MARAMVTDSSLSDDQYNGLTVAALEAGQVIMEIYGQSIDVELKDDRTPVTKADAALSM